MLRRITGVCAVCLALASACDERGGTTDGGSTSGGTTGGESTSGTTGEADVSCPPEETDVSFATAWTGEFAGFGYGNRTCIIDAISFDGGALGLDLSCQEEEGRPPGPTRLDISASPPLQSHPFVAGETVHIFDSHDSGNEVTRVERPDSTVLMHAVRGNAGADERGIVGAGEELCDSDDPCGRLVYSRLKIDPGDGAFEVMPWSHTQSGAYWVWTGRSTSLDNDTSCVVQHFLVEALVLRDAP